MRELQGKACSSQLPTCNFQPVCCDRAGLLSCCNILLLSFALKFGDASTMIPIANTSFVFTLGLSLVTGMEKLDRCVLCTYLPCTVAVIS